MFFYVGGCNVITTRPDFDPREALRIIRAENITDIQIVPTQMVAILGLPEVK